MFADVQEHINNVNNVAAKFQTQTLLFCDSSTSVMFIGLGLNENPWLPPTPKPTMRNQVWKVVNLQLEGWHHKKFKLTYFPDQQATWTFSLG